MSNLAVGHILYIKRLVQDATNLAIIFMIRQRQLPTKAYRGQI